MKNKTKYLVAILLMLVSFLLIGATNVNAETKTVDVVDKDSLETAMNDKTTDIVRLTENITLRNDLDTIFSIEKSKTLDLNGHTITVPDGRIIKFWYYADADIKIMNSSNSSSAKIIGNHTGASTYFLLDGAILKEGLKINFEIDGVDFEVDGSDFVTIVKGNHEGRNYESLVIKNSNVNGNQYLFWSGSAKKVYLESITLKGADRNLYRQLSNTSSLTVNDVIDANSVIEYYPSAGVKATADRSAKLNTSNLNAYWGPITVKFANGFNVSNATLNGKYGETPETNITIKNIGENNLQIKNVTVSDATQFEIIGNTQPTVSAGATNTDFKVKAKAGLDVGTYTATITVEAMDSKTYTATVTLKVEPKQLTGLGISGLDNTWFYGETKTPTATGVTGLGAGDYEITYSKKGDSENYVNIGNKLPTLVGKYKATLSITNPNYTASEASVDFEIKPITTEVKVKSYDAEFTYDGLEHTKNAYDVLWANNASPRTDNKLPNGDKVTAVITGKVRDVKDTALENNTIGKITITNKDNVDVTNCYSNIVKAAGKLTVNPITTPIVVTAGSDTKVYNCTELTKNTYTYTDGVLLSGDMLEVAITGSQKFVGSSNNTVSNVKVMRNGEDITSNYTMGTHVNGVLEVTSAEQPLAIADQYVKVNGSISKGYLEQSVTGNVGNIDFTIKSGTALTYDAINDEYVAGATAGDVVMTVTAAKMDLGGDNTPEWKETSKDFKVHVVNKTDVNITGLSNNETFTYDGNPKMPTGTISVNAGTVNVSDLEVKYQGTGTTSYNSATAPTNAGTYTVTYKVPDTNANYTGTFSVAFTIKKAQLDKVTLIENTFEYTGDEIVSDGSNFYSTKMNMSGDIKATNVGNYSITVSLKDKDNYEWKDGTTTDLVLNWSITQATPNYTVPTGLTSVKGKILADVVLPTGFTWNAPATVLTVGTNTYKATYTPVDTTNYKTITDIDIEVDVKNTFNVITSVPGGNGTITPSKIDVIEGSKVKITFTPNTGYMIDKVLVNGIEKTVTGNEIEITVDEEKTVEVSYKKIPFTITVEEVTGATVNPDGTVTVGYGDNKDFTITANIGYKLVKVLVNDVEKALDGNTLKLKNITSNMKIKVVVEKIEYKVIEGAEQTYTIKEDTEARFRIDADYSLFNNKVYVDNVLVDSSNYTSKSGSTIITLKKEFVDTLSVGEHTLKVVFNDGGEAETTFTIEKKAENNNNNENNTPSKPEDKEEMKDNGSNPKTGDNIMLYVAIASMSIIGLVATTIVAKKKKMN
ncbi:MAG TPA: MBG domain-containing protein [Clostridiaceae bacterium]|nr:MBG domain-containing protein [Clostridiaceae bacterium]